MRLALAQIDTTVGDFEGNAAKILGSLARAEEAGYRTVIGGIDADNHASIALHAQLGFTHAGTVRQSGYKFGRWLDLAFYQRLLPGPAHPVEG